MPMKRAALYVRVSSPDQHIETQLCDLRPLAAARGVEIVGEYSDKISGTKAKRPGPDQLMSDAQRGEFDIVMWVCSVGVMILFALGSSRGILSPRGLGIAIAMLCFGIAIGMMLIIKTSAKELGVPPGPLEGPPTPPLGVDYCGDFGWRKRRSS
jgi:hypothetical protein